MEKETVLFNCDYLHLQKLDVTVTRDPSIFGSGAEKLPATSSLNTLYVVLKPQIAHIKRTMHFFRIIRVGAKICSVVEIAHASEEHADTVGQRLMRDMRKFQHHFLCNAAEFVQTANSGNKRPRSS